ncbi:MAG: hypothetical protein ACTHLJ_09185 [Angustibacter sp.]
MKRLLVVVVSSLLLVLSGGTPAVAQESTVGLEVVAESQGLSIPIGRTVGTVCDPQHWAEPGARPCDVLIFGTYHGTLTRGSTGTPELVWGFYRARVTITTAAHAPGCLEVGGGPVTYATYGAGGRWGTVVSALDESDSQACQLPGSTDRNYFLRSDPVSGTGMFAGVQGGTTNLVGGGTRASGRSAVYRNHLSFYASVWFPN